MQSARPGAFGREVLDEGTGEVLDERLGRHGYQLWTAAVGTIIEAQQREVPSAVLAIHQFLPRDLGAAAEAGDKREWRSALAANAERLDEFATAMQASGSRSHDTDFVEAGTTVQVVKVDSAIDW